MFIYVYLRADTNCTEFLTLNFKIFFKNKVLNAKY